MLGDGSNGSKEIVENERFSKILNRLMVKTRKYPGILSKYIISQLYSFPKRYY